MEWPISWEDVKKALEKVQISEGGAGYSETKVLTFDGDVDGKELTSMGPGNGLVRVSNTPFDLTSPRYVKVVVNNETKVIEECMVQVLMDGFQYLGVEIEGINVPIMAVLSVSGDIASEDMPAGVWMWYANENYFVSEVCLDINHVIDPKYLPEGVLPIVELKQPEGEELTEAENTNLTARIGMPCIIKFTNYQDIVSVMVANYMCIPGDEGLIHRFMCVSSSGALTVTSTDGVSWRLG